MIGSSFFFLLWFCILITVFVAILWKRILGLTLTVHELSLVLLWNSVGNQHYYYWIQFKAAYAWLSLLRFPRTLPSLPWHYLWRLFSQKSIFLFSCLLVLWRIRHYLQDNFCILCTFYHHPIACFVLTKRNLGTIGCMNAEFGNLLDIGSNPYCLPLKPIFSCGWLFSVMLLILPLYVLIAASRYAMD